jgi:hypothetical protein
VLRRWVALADADGAHRSHDHAWQHRRARLCFVGDEVHLDARGGAFAGAQIQEVFDRFCDTLLRAG